MGFSHKPAPGPVTMARGMECTDHGSLSHSCTPGAGGASAVRNRETNAATVDLLHTGSRRLARPGEASCMVSSLINTQEHWLEEAPDSSVKSVVTKRSVSQLLKTCSSRKKKKKILSVLIIPWLLKYMKPEPLLAWPDASSCLRGGQ